MLGLEKYATAAQPVEFGIFIALSLPLAIVTLAFLLLKKNNQVFWCLACAILLELAFRNGDELSAHASRLLGAADALRHRNFTGLLMNPQSGQASPVFVYTGILPYIVPLWLLCAGVPAYVSVKLALALYFLLFCYGLQRLFGKTAPPQMQFRNANLAFLILCLFLCSTSVYGVWALRNALGEAAVYALIPWVVMALLSRNAAAALMLFFLQLAAHPLAFAQSLVCECALAYGISALSLASLLRRLLLPIAAALIWASPFWLPQILWLKSIAASGAMPPFSATFLRLPELLSPIYRYTPGPWLILALALIILRARKCFSGRAWLLTSGFVLTLAIQTTYLRFATLAIPAIGVLQSAWQLMMPAAFIGLAALLAGFTGNERKARIRLTALLLAAIVNLLLCSFIYTPQHRQITADDRNSHAPMPGDGMRIDASGFGPDSSRLQNCALPQSGATQAMDYQNLRNGAVPNRPLQRLMALRGASLLLGVILLGVHLAWRSSCGSRPRRH